MLLEDDSSEQEEQESGQGEQARPSPPRPRPSSPSEVQAGPSGAVTQVANSTRRKRARTSDHRPNNKRSDQELGWIFDDTPPALPVFSEISGVSAPLDSTSTVSDCFNIFFSRDMVKHIKTETNRYAASIIDKLKRTNTLKKNSLWKVWQPVKIHEIYLFFAIIAHMCLVKKTKVREYWCKNFFLATPFPSSVMSRDRFRAILTNLHLNDNRTYVPRNEPGHDPLHKIRPYFDHIVNKFSTSFQPSSKLTIDEGMCGFRGRVHFRVYLKNKPDKYGMKLFIVSDARSGYVVKMEVYCGKGIEDNSIIPLIERLLSKYLDKGYTIYMDRFYSSPALFDFLWNRQTKAVGTCMPNRKELPKENVVNKKIKRGEIIFMRRGPLLCLKWKDTRDVLMLTTEHKATSSEVVVRTKQGNKNKIKPDVVLDYNINKTGVDRSDQMIAYYPFKRKQLKWWKKLFFHLFVMSISNAFMLYRETRQPEMKKNVHLASFMRDLGEYFVKEGGKEAQSQPGTSSTSNRLLGRHFVDKIPPTEKKAHPTRVCKVCTDKSKAVTGKSGRKETSWWCSVCEVGLCVPECFKIYHTKANYV